jgi:CheY-like chemotaxis protein
MKPLKLILLVDDSPRDTEMALEALASHNLANEVVTLRDGAEALDYLYRRGEFAGRASGQPAVILLDLKMPKVDGTEVLRQIKSDPDLKIIPVVVMTSSREEQDVVTSYRLGVNGYVVKPVNFQEFVEAVRQLGVFWGVFNEPPPGGLPSLHRTAPDHSTDRKHVARNEGEDPCENPIGPVYADVK